MEDKKKKRCVCAFVSDRGDVTNRTCSVEKYEEIFQRLRRRQIGMDPTINIAG